MTVWVYRDGQIVEKRFRSVAKPALAAPMVSRFEAMESPVTGKSISSWRERDRDMKAADAVDPRDIPAAAFEKRKRTVERNVRSGNT
jgi:hypothetical protein